jgi:cytochrome P450
MIYVHAHSLAWAEIRLVLAKLLWNFDLELVDNSDDWWLQQDTFIVWKRNPLIVKLYPRTT